MNDPHALLQFWFSPDVAADWFRQNPALDDQIRQRYLPLYESARSGQLARWEMHAEGALALVIVLDQFPRNMFRGDAHAFAADEQAREVAARAIERGYDQQLSPIQRSFMYLPYMHSESLADQKRSLALYDALGNPLNLDFARKHHSIIARFGRFPQRNAALDRINNTNEAAFLEIPGNYF